MHEYLSQDITKLASHAWRTKVPPSSVMQNTLIGFAGGLVDADTGLVRFGWRDYVPKVGRFTAPDPANDRRGDGDVYDYCVDDPVSRKDTTGLAWWIAVPLGV